MYYEHFIIEIIAVTKSCQSPSNRVKQCAKWKRETFHSGNNSWNLGQLDLEQKWQI